jgi:murein L,D-transpeptidase YcbB/YkuD
MNGSGLGVRRRILWTMFLGWLVLGPALASEADLAAPIRAILTEGKASGFGASGLSATQLRAFYERRAFAPAWSGSAAAERDADIALDILKRAGEQGLDDGAYRLRETLLRRNASAPADRAAFDLLLSDGLLRYMADVRDGRTELRALDRDVGLAPKTFDAPAALEDALRAGRLAEFLAALPPPGHPYRELERALARYRNIAAGGGWPAAPEAMTKDLGADTPETAALRRRLEIEYPTPPAEPAGDLKLAVEAFQARHGLEADGKVGPKTLQALNVSASERADQIAMNMERWRWLPRDLGSRYVIVNAANATLAVVEDGRTVLRSKVIVGKPFQRTPIFAAAIDAITVNPDWNIPAKIARNEIWPKARRNPGYLSRNHIVIGPAGGLRQLPGADNALGRIKLEMPNRFASYLHDTPARSLFARNERHLSHGCIRVEEIKALASFALTGDATRGLERIEPLIEQNSTTTISLDRPLSVYVLYWTAFLGENGAVDFAPDVYGRDRRMLAKLAGKPVAGRVTMNEGECWRA